MTTLKTIRVYPMDAAYKGDKRHAQQIVRDLGITDYQLAVPQSISGSWEFWNCTGVPDVLPSFVKLWDTDPCKRIGSGLSQKDVDDILAYRKKHEEISTPPQATQSSCQPVVADAEGLEHPENFGESQWWYKELDAVAKTSDQRRAMAVVRHLMASAKHFAAPKAYPRGQTPHVAHVDELGYANSTRKQMTNFETTYRERFAYAVALICGTRPSPELVDAWVDNTDDSHKLQSFAAEHGPEWAQGIVVLDAAHVLAATPEEGANHEVIEKAAYSGTFGWAVEMMRVGKFVARSDWQGAYLWYMPPAAIPKGWLKEPHLVALCGDQESIEVLGTVRMRTEDGKVLTGWTATQPDLFATDWELVEPAQQPSGL